jgi:DNA-directed RNA polymerase subunit M/transcription elongation factor TFIIS
VTRDNQTRLGAVPEEEDIQISEETPSAQPLSFVVPTDFVDLPSRGEAYLPNHPLHKQTSVEVRFMTAKEEDILTSQALLEKGLALDRLIQNILVNKLIKVESLLIGDKNAILMNARKNGYGPDYNTTVSCPRCGATSDAEYDLNEVENKYLPTSAELEENDIESGGAGTFYVMLPTCKVSVEFRLLTSEDEALILKLSERRRKKKAVDKLVTDQLKLLVLSANGETDGKILGQFVESLSLHDTRALREAYEVVAPNIEMKEVFVCGDCGHEDDINFPVTTDFFWPQQ